jgi:hypothetical protein
MTTATLTRDSYGAIALSTLTDIDPQLIRNLVQDVTSADKIDEHGGWDFGIQKLTRRRSRALNWDLYGYGYDVHSGNLLAVIQVREWTEGSRWNSVRKSYFLIGHNEDGSAFAHPVGHAPIHAAIKAGRDVVEAVQNWIFGGDYRNMIRHGDLVIVPMSKRPAGTKGQLRRKAILQESHEVVAAQIAQVEDRIYARNPHLRHIPGVHPDVEAQGWCRIIVGKRATAWNFAAPTID